MKKALKLIIAIAVIAITLTSCGEDRKIQVESIIYRTETVTIDFETKKGDVIKVCGGVAYKYDATAIVQHIGHIATVK